MPRKGKTHVRGAETYRARRRNTCLHGKTTHVWSAKWYFAPDKVLPAHKRGRFLVPTPTRSSRHIPKHAVRPTSIRRV